MQFNLTSEPLITKTSVALVELRRIIASASASMSTELLIDIPKNAPQHLVNSCILKLYGQAQTTGPGQAVAAAVLWDLALRGALMLPASGRSLKEIAPVDYPFQIPALIVEVDAYVQGEQPRWLQHDTHIRLLLATDCRLVQDFDIFAFETLHTGLVKNGTLNSSKALINLPAYMLLRGIERAKGSTLLRHIRHGYILWRASESDKMLSFSEFLSDPAHLADMSIHGHARERVVLAVHKKQRNALQSVIRSDKKVKRTVSPFLQNLLKIATENTDNAPELYFASLSKGSNVKGFRPEGWIEQQINYPGRDGVNIGELGRNWFVAFRAFLSRRSKDYESEKQVRAGLHVLADYLLVYLPWWMEKNPDTTISFPTSPKLFLRYLFVDRTRFTNDATFDIKTLPKTFNDLLHLRRPTPGARNACRIILHMFFNFVITYFEDSPEFGTGGMLNPIRTDFDNEVAGRPGKTNKVPFPENVFPFLIHYGQAVEAFGEFLQQEAYERHIFREMPNGCIEGYQTMDWGFVPIFWYRGHLYQVDWIPCIYLISSRRIKSNPSGPEGLYVQGHKINQGVPRDVMLNFPHLTVVRMLNAMVESGLRAQSLQWLDRRRFDLLAPPLTSITKLYKNIQDQCYHALYVNTDKSHEPWSNLVSWRVRRALLAEKHFQDSVTDKYVNKEVNYEDRENSRFSSIIPLFRSDRTPKPIADTTYTNRWIDFLHGFQVFYNRRDGVDRSDCADSLSVLTERDGVNKNLPISDRFLAIHTPHACRATYATQKDGDLEVSEIADQLGHSNTVVTSHYQVPSVKRLTEKLKRIDEKLLGTGIYDPDGDDAAVLHPDHENSTVRHAFNKDRGQAISDFGFVPGIALWSLSELDGDTSTLELLQQSPASIIRWHPTHVCPVGNQCPKEVVANTGEMYRCGICPLAAKCVDHLTAIEAKQNELKERIRTLATRLKRLTELGVGQPLLDGLHREMQLDTKELLGWKLSAEILRAKQNALGTGDASYHVDQPELVRKQLQLVSRNQNESQFFLQRIADSNAYPSLESSEVRAKASRYTRLILAQQGRMAEAAFLDVQPHTELSVFASHVKPFIQANGLTLNDLAAAIDALPQTAALSVAGNNVPFLLGT
jgi:hypothetical protein